MTTFRTSSATYLALPTSEFANHSPDEYKPPPPPSSKPLRFCTKRSLFYALTVGLTLFCVTKWSTMPENNHASYAGSSPDTAKWTIKPRSSVIPLDRELEMPKVPGSEIKLFSFQPWNDTNEVVLPVYMDDWVNATTTKLIKRVVVHIHGREREPWTAYLDATQARQLSNVPDNSTLIIAPTFFNGLDKNRYGYSGHNSTGNLLVYKGNGWAEGDPNQYPATNPNISSFEVLDNMVSYLAHQFPNLTHITLSGHSLGGQLIHRYSVLGDVSSRIPVSFVTMNPASYLFLSSDRPGPTAPGINEYKYGLDNVTAHFPSYPPVLFLKTTDFVHRFLNSSRSIHFLNGMEDTGLGDERAGALSQGDSRATRAKNYKLHVENISKMIGSALKSFTFDWIPGVGHDGRMMFASQDTIKRVFIDT